ncbi:hypothetical protein CEXT_442921 [Caerostris extrusa]|uniref:Uncharacterized protein n=1 Tax=Caerostris extrusa TaxID=172846 RepID=A0AAV4NR53_CAEEX|nr:hypothetical protein CEXT_442921 [Caerostris extrusa]
MLEDVTERNRARSVEPKRAESTDIKPDIRIHVSCELILEDSYPILNMGGRLDGTLENKFKPRKEYILISNEKKHYRECCKKNYHKKYGTEETCSRHFPFHFLLHIPCIEHVPPSINLVAGRFPPKTVLPFIPEQKCLHLQSARRLSWLLSLNHGTG